MLLKLVQNIINYTVFVPGMLIVLIPALPFCRLSKKLTIAICVSVTVFFCMTGAAIETFTNITVPSILLVVICLLLGWLPFKLTPGKYLYLFCTSSAILSYGGYAYELTAAMLNPAGPSGFSPVATLVQYTFSAMALIFIIAVRKRIIWVLEQFNPANFWGIIWLIPAVVVLTNIYTVPEVYANMHVGRIFIKTVIFVSLSFFLFITIQILLYFHVQDAVMMARTESERAVYDMEEKYFNNVQVYLNETSRMRHDFRQVIRTIQGLLAQGEYEKLKDYTDEYFGSASERFRPVTFTEDIPINSMLNHYYSQCQEDRIVCSWKVSLPGNLPISDMDLSVIVGNLLENAIRACRELKDRERYINLKIDLDTPGTLFITIVNSCSDDTEALMQKRKNSKKRRGMGLASVELSAKKYDGAAQFRAVSNQFISNVCLQVKAPKD